MTNSFKRPTRRQAMVAFGAVGAAGVTGLLAGCGGGTADDSSGATTFPGGLGVLTPGSATVTVTNEVTLTVRYTNSAGTLTTGTIVVGLDATHAPVTTANFLAYVTAGTYNGSLFQRLVAGFVAQGGGYIDSGGTGVSNGNYTLLATNAAIALESQNGLSNTQYTIAMARVGGEPDSATDQFYFNLANNASSLDYPGGDGDGYAVFGTINLTDGPSIATLNAIAALPVESTSLSNGEASWPVTDVVIVSAVKNY